MSNNMKYRHKIRICNSLKFLDQLKHTKYSATVGNLTKSLYSYRACINILSKHDERRDSQGFILIKK